MLLSTYNGTEFLWIDLYFYSKKDIDLIGPKELIKIFQKNKELYRLLSKKYI